MPRGSTPPTPNQWRFIPVTCEEARTYRPYSNPELIALNERKKNTPLTLEAFLAQQRSLEQKDDEANGFGFVFELGSSAHRAHDQHSAVHSDSSHPPFDGKTDDQQSAYYTEEPLGDLSLHRGIFANEGFSVFGQGLGTSNCNFVETSVLAPRFGGTSGDVIFQTYTPNSATTSVVYDPATSQEYKDSMGIFNGVFDAGAGHPEYHYPLSEWADISQPMLSWNDGVAYEVEKAESPSQFSDWASEVSSPYGGSEGHGESQSSQASVNYFWY